MEYRWNIRPVDHNSRRPSGRLLWEIRDHYAHKSLDDLIKDEDVENLTVTFTGVEVIHVLRLLEDLRTNG